MVASVSCFAGLESRLGPRCLEAGQHWTNTRCERLRRLVSRLARPLLIDYFVDLILFFGLINLYIIDFFLFTLVFLIA